MDFEQLSADLESKPIKGWLHTGEAVNIPLISHIVDNLYVGGCIHGVDLGDYFSHIIAMYQHERYFFDADSTVRLDFTMHDGAFLDLYTLDDAVEVTHEALNGGGNVLVHCQAGINRSNLVAASVLRERGYTTEEAITLLKRRSPHILANKTFMNYLRGE